MSYGRHIGGSFLPSNDPTILKPMQTPFGTLEVRVLKDLDTHALFRTDERGTTMIVEHSNGFSCHELAKRMIAGDETRIRQQIDYIQKCGGMARHPDHIVEITRNGR